MIKKTLHILILDDHPMNVEGIREALNKLTYDFIFKEATDIDTALLLIQQQPNILPFDVAFIDIELPPSKTTNIHSGEGVALVLKRKFPDCKIIIPTQYFQAERLKHIIKTVIPDALLSKIDFRRQHIRNALESVLKNESYYSPSVIKILRSHDFELDEHDLKILYCLSKHIKIKDMPTTHVNLSLRTIEERKKKLMEKFDVPSRDNELLIQIAKEKGLI